MKMTIALLAAAAALIVYALFFMEGAPPIAFNSCPEHTFGDTNAYIAWLRSQGLECEVVRYAEEVGGIPNDCDWSRFHKSIFIICHDGKNFSYRTAYETLDGDIIEFPPEEGGGSAPGENGGGGGSEENHIQVSSHCFYMLFDDPFWYAQKQQNVGFNCTLANESSEIYGMTLVCREYLMEEAQKDAGMELVGTMYFECYYPDGKSNVFPVFETADGRYVFFGELK